MCWPTGTLLLLFKCRNNIYLNSIFNFKYLQPWAPSEIFVGEGGQEPKGLLKDKKGPHIVKKAPP